MSFVSPEFALLCLFFFPVYWSLGWHPTRQRQLLLVSGYTLYATWSAYFAGALFIYSTIIWLFGCWLAGGNQLRLKLSLGVTLCAGFLIAVKYFTQIRDGLAALFEAMGLSIVLPFIDIAAPVGVSFFTFQAITYLVAVAKNDHGKRSYSDVLLFLCFWPTLFAGPILRSSNFFTQIDDGTTGKPRQPWLAIYFILLGLAQKVVFASWLADGFVDNVFKYPENYGGLALLSSILGYSLQIFLDFGGYTLIVTGLGLFLGFELPINFRQPYLARNLQDFWTRWHISLSTWIRDYIYIPLGGSRGAFSRTQANLLFGMALSGAWHGASLTFLVWGILHGFGVMAFNIYKRNYDKPLPSWLAHFLTLGFIMIAWVFFRADSFDGAMTILTGLFINELGFWTYQDISIFSLIGFSVLFWIASNHANTIQTRVVHALQSLRLVNGVAVVSLTLVLVIAAGPDGVPGFIYYRF